MIALLLFSKKNRVNTLNANQFLFVIFDVYKFCILKLYL